MSDQSNIKTIEVDGMPVTIDLTSHNRARSWNIKGVDPVAIQKLHPATYDKVQEQVGLVFAQQEKDKQREQLLKQDKQFRDFVDSMRGIVINGYGIHYRYNITEADRKEYNICRFSIVKIKDSTKSSISVAGRCDTWRSGATTQPNEWVVGAEDAGRSSICKTLDKAVASAVKRLEKIIVEKELRKEREAANEKRNAEMSALADENARVMEQLGKKVGLSYNKYDNSLQYKCQRSESEYDRVEVMGAACKDEFLGVTIHNLRTSSTLTMGQFKEVAQLIAAYDLQNTKKMQEAKGAAQAKKEEAA